MPLITLNEILPQARKKGVAIAAFNVANLETLLAVINAAEAEKAPVIVQVYERLLNTEHGELIAAMTTMLAQKIDIPVVLHLDHGVSVAQLKTAIDAGYTSVMIDGSKLPFNENVALTKQVVKIARDAGVSIEAEIGHVPFGGGEMEHSTVKDAVSFAEKTGVDSLAISIGTAHGFYKKTPELDINRAKEIGKSVDIPLVLHGGSGTPEDQIKAVIECGIAKVNIATEYQNLFLNETQRLLKENAGKFKPLDLFFAPCLQTLTEFARGRIRTFKKN